MTNKINGIDVSECPCKDDDKCLETPILNEYGDLIDYQDCEPQTLCPYRSKTKIQRLQEENNILKQTIKNKNFVAIAEENKELYEKNVQLKEENEELKKYQYTQEYLQSEIEKRQKALEEIREMLKKSMSLKSNAYNHFINVEKAIDKINEVLNDR